MSTWPMTIPSGRGRNGDLSITIILLKSESALHLSRSISPSINQDSKQALFPQSWEEPKTPRSVHPSHQFHLLYLSLETSYKNHAQLAALAVASNSCGSERRTAWIDTVLRPHTYSDQQTANHNH